MLFEVTVAADGCAGCELADEEDEPEADSDKDG